MVSVYVCLALRGIDHGKVPRVALFRSCSGLDKCPFHTSLNRGSLLVADHLEFAPSLRDMVHPSFSSVPFPPAGDPAFYLLFAHL